MKDLELDQKFEKQIFQKIRNGNFYVNEILNSLRIAIELQKGTINNAFLAPMQSGKTGTIKHLCNLILPKIKFIKEHESILFLTSMTDKDLKYQNMRALEGYDSNIYVMPMHKLKSHGLAQIDNFNVKLIVRDEDQYGCGKESSFDTAFFNNIRKLVPDLPLLSVSATPFDVLDAKVKGINVNVIDGLRHGNYFGVTEMLNQGLIRSLPEKYEHFKAQGDRTIISDTIKTCISKLRNSEKGFGVIRCRNTYQAVELKQQLLGFEKENLETIIIGCRKEIGADYPIQDGLSILPRKIRVEKKKVILLVIGALSAGKDLKKLKNDCRFMIETRSKQVANCVQGLPGRVCGYHENRDIIIFANKKILEYYSDFENNPDLFNDEKWINDLYFDEKVKTISTQTRLALGHNEGIQIPIKQCLEISIEEIFSEEGEKLLSFLSNEEFKGLRSSFDIDKINSNKRISISRSEIIQIRIASNYKRYNNVYSCWNKQVGDNIKGLFNHNNKNAMFGILVANHPKDDERNKINFCGVKLFVPGNPKKFNRSSKTYNKSMYHEEIN